MVVSLVVVVVILQWMTQTILYTIRDSGWREGRSRGRGREGGKERGGGEREGKGGREGEREGGRERRLGR